MRTGSGRTARAEQHSLQIKSQEKSLTPTKGKRVKKVQRLLLRQLPKKLLPNKPRVSSLHTTSITTRPDRCLRNSTAQKPEEGHRRNGWSPPIQRLLQNRTLSPRLQPTKPITVFLC